MPVDAARLADSVAPADVHVQRRHRRRVLLVVGVAGEAFRELADETRRLVAVLAGVARVDQLVGRSNDWTGVVAADDRGKTRDPGQLRRRQPSGARTDV